MKWMNVIIHFKNFNELLFQIILYLFSDVKSGDSGKLQQSILLLQLLENLEKLMYNAFEGCAVSLPPQQRVSLYRD